MIRKSDTEELSELEMYYNSKMLSPIYAQFSGDIVSTSALSFFLSIISIIIILLLFLNTYLLQYLYERYTNLCPS